MDGFQDWDCSTVDFKIDNSTVNISFTSSPSLMNCCPHLIYCDVIIKDIHFDFRFSNLAMVTTWHQGIQCMHSGTMNLIQLGISFVALPGCYGLIRLGISYVALPGCDELHPKHVTFAGCCFQAFSYVALPGCYEFRKYC